MEITAHTKVYDLLQAFPQLETVLIDLSPNFNRLKNPILRNSLARVATLEQAATVAGVPLLSLLNRLRSEVDQSPLEI